MKNLKFYTCEYCYKEFEPKRRRVQRYCSNTCRSKAYHARKTNTLTTSKSEDIAITNNDNSSQKETMSLAGIGNATAGTLAADAIKSLLTKESNKPATKGDLTQLLEKLNGRYHLVKNMNPNIKGEYPYFDMVEGNVVYSPYNN
ncbi:hypothetical protein [Winogradskyella sp. Asnod2-B02-A]|uniref:hypothetical protein n=1 Tax=Winogradskyella sp. Asnod2-B02-A TaxID=3160583 RepID=UPI00386FA4DD